MNLKPVGDRVIIKQDEAGETTSSGLYIATESKEKPQSGTVLAVGEGKLDKDGNMVPMPVKEGDRVISENFPGADSGDLSGPLPDERTTTDTLEV